MNEKIEIVKQWQALQNKDTINAVNFDILIINCTSYGTTYNPSKALLKVVAMQAQSTAAKNSLTTINALTPAYKNAVSAHKVAFLSIDKLFTRIGNALKVSDTTVQVDESAQTIIRKYKVAEQTLKRQKNRKTCKRSRQ